MGFFTGMNGLVVVLLALRVASVWFTCGLQDGRAVQTRVAQACGCTSAEVTGTNRPHGERPYSGRLGQGGLQLLLQHSVHAAQTVSEWRAPPPSESPLVALFRDFEAKLAGRRILPLSGQW